MNPCNYHVIEHDGRKYFVKTAHDRHRYVNEFLYSGLAPRGFLLGVGAYVPEAVILEGPDGLTGAIEYLPGLRPSTRQLTPDAVSAMAVLDACFHNCDRTLKNVGVVPGAKESVWFDHEHALIGNGTTDLHRFRRTDIPLRDYIKTPGLTTVDPGVIKRTIAEIHLSVGINLLAVVEYVLEAELISNEATQALYDMDHWLDEVSRRIDSGEFFQEIQVSTHVSRCV